ELRAILFKCSVAHLDPLPFPTRRSSDLYLIPWTALLGVDKGSVLSAANGTWFIWVVGSQAVAVLAATLQPMFVDWRQALAMLARSEEHTSELQSRENLVCRLLLEKKKGR